MEPHPGNGVDGIAQNIATVLTQAAVGLGRLVEFLGEVLFVKLLRNKPVGHKG